MPPRRLDGKSNPAYVKAYLAKRKADGSIARWNHSEKGKAARERFKNSEKGKTCEARRKPRQRNKLRQREESADAYAKRIIGDVEYLSINRDL